MSTVQAMSRILLRRNKFTHILRRLRHVPDPSPLRTTSSMRAITVDPSGNPTVTRRLIPKPQPGQVLMRVHSAALNRADLLQLAGKYPPPPGVTDVLGLEAAGTLPDGTRACALLAGGGLAEYVVVSKDAILQLPKDVNDSLSFCQLASIPEAFVAAHHVLFDKARLAAGESIYINAAASGVGTASIQLAATLPGANIVASAGSARKLEALRSLGATHTFNYHDCDVADAVASATGGEGVHVAMDAVGAAQFAGIARALRTEGRWVMYGLSSGAKSSQMELARIVSKRLSIVGTTLRSRPESERCEIVKRFTDGFGEEFRQGGLLSPVVHKVLCGLDAALQGYASMKENENVGKIVLRLQ